MSLIEPMNKEIESMIAMVICYLQIYNPVSNNSFSKLLVFSL